MTKSTTLLLLTWLPCGCRLPPLAQEEDKEARRLLSALGTSAPQTVPGIYTSGSPDLHRYQTGTDFSRSVAQLRQRVGQVQSVTRTDVCVTRTMAAEKTSQIYHVIGSRGQTDVKLYLTRQKGRWVLDGLRLGEIP